MAGYNTIIKIRRLEEECERIGFMMSHADHYHKDYGDVVAVRPKDQNSLPIYSRDAELFVGTFEEPLVIHQHHFVDLLLIFFF